jgi:flagellar biosynthesis protein FlhF
VLLNVQIHNPSPLTYITNGQRVPEDILAMTPRLAAELIISAQQEGLHG